VVCTALLGAALWAPGPSYAANSKVTIGVGFKPEVGNPRFHGTIRSGRRACTRGRVVSVFRVINKGRVVRFGSTRTGPRGHWRIDMNKNMVPGGYFARARARGSCEEDKSREIAVGQSGPDGTGPGGTE
jgi:hypothetical protein